RVFEHNLRYDTRKDQLFKTTRLLRLRKDRQTTLTLKSPPPVPDPRFKIHREREVQVSDFDTMDAILNALGYFRKQVYQKWRETWQLKEALLCVDALPFGTFLEIEGPPDRIMTICDDLDLDWKRRILSSYLALFATLREKEGWAFSDVTFDNFTSVDISFERYRHLFEAGPA
ncbi:MAG: class IV adenylate cyclase, partial [Desulfosarcina sp.]